MKDKYLKLLSFAGIVFGFTWAIVYPILTPYTSMDFDHYIRAGRGDLSLFYYASYSIPFFNIFNWMPYDLARIVANVLNCLCFLWALHIFGGGKGLFFVSYPLFSLMFYGQVDGFFLFGLLIMYLSLQRPNKNWQTTLIVIGGWIIALIKIQIGLPLGLALLWIYADWRLRWQVITATLVFALITNLVWPLWMLDWWSRIQTKPPDDLYSVDAWNLFGPLLLLLWVPLLIWPVKEFRLWVVTWTLTIPYLWPYSLTLLLVFPVGIAGWWINIGYILGPRVRVLLLVVPLIIYVRYWLGYFLKKEKPSQFLENFPNTSQSKGI